MTLATIDDLRLLDLVDLTRELNLSRTKLLALLEDPGEAFPAPIRVGKRNMWRRASVSAWLAKKAGAADAA